MSLLVVNSGSRIAQGVIRSLYQKGQFEKIVCADLYPSYQEVQNFCEFKDSLQNSKCQVTDTKITEKQDIQQLLKKSTHVLYVTHNYYQNVPSKQNILKATAESVSEARNIKKFVALLPTEYEHQNDSDAKNLSLDVTCEVRSDLVFGNDSDLVFQVLFKLANSQNFVFKPSSSNASPVFDKDLANLVQNLLVSEKSGKFVAKGNESIGLNQLKKTLESAIGVNSNGSNPVDVWLSPTSSNLLTQLVHDPSYIHFAQFWKNYQEVQGQSSLEGKTQSFSEFYPKNSLSRQDFQNKQGDSLSKSLFY